MGLIGWLIVAGLAILALATVLLPAFVGGAWSPTPMRIVRRMAELGNLRAGETLYDLGAGDGRVILHAAKAHGAHSVGIEVDPFKCFFIGWRLRLGGATRNARVERRNFFDADLSGADVVFSYLSPVSMERLRDKFERELRPGTRVVSYRRVVPGWTQDAEEDGIYVYTVRANNSAPELAGTSNP